MLMQGLIRMLAGVLYWILSKPSLPHAGKGHCFGELTLSHTPHYGCWMGPGGVISGTHLRFIALDYQGSQCSNCFTRCHSGGLIFIGRIDRVYHTLLLWLTLMQILLTRYLSKHAAIWENYCCKSRAAACGHTSQVIL